MTVRGSVGPGGLVAWALAYPQPLRRRLAGPAAPVAPVALGFLAVCLLVALLWDTPGPPTRLADACCGYRGWRPGFGLGSTDRPEKGESETAEKGESQSESENGSDKEGDRHEDPPGQEVQHECPSDCDTANGEQP